MNSKRPYTHILKNLLHEQATEIVPLLLPRFRVEEALDVEQPELLSIPRKEPPGPLEQGIVSLVLPEAQVVQVYETQWIEHSGNFERAYRVRAEGTDKPTYLLIEFQLEREDKQIPRHLLAHFARLSQKIGANGEYKSDGDGAADEVEAPHEHRGTIMNRGYDIYPEMLCPFPQAVPSPIRDEFRGEVMLKFNFLVIGLWEKDAREFLNTHVSAIYFLLPAMKNADASLLGLAITELAQRFQDDDKELGRHLTGLNLMLQMSETMSEEEKLATQGHLKRFAHLMKDNPNEE